MKPEENNWKIFKLEQLGKSFDNYCVNCGTSGYKDVDSGLLGVAGVTGVVPLVPWPGCHDG